MNVQVVEDTSSGCGSSYSVFIVSDDFEGKNTLARHKLGKWLFALVIFLAIMTEICDRSLGSQQDFEGTHSQNACFFSGE